MLKRLIEKDLLEWFETQPDKALCIIGARQTGKTTIVREFAAAHFTSFLELNFLEDQSAARIFDTASSTEDILLQLENYRPEITLVPGKSLIWLDEIQECPAARTAVKFLIENGKYRYIETGSLPGVRIADVWSVPVGYEQLVNMYPLTFEEFLWGAGIRQELIARLKESFAQRSPVPEYLHEQMLKLYRTYLVVGGMPGACASFFKDGNLERVRQIQHSIIRLYEQDIMKYASLESRTWILEIFKQIPGQLSKPNHRFVLNRIQKGARISQLSDYFSWLSEAGIVLPCFNTAVPQIPLVLSEKRNLFRLYMLDTGLLVSLLEGSAVKLLQNDPTLNWGAILENAAAQSLVSSGFELCYFHKKAIGEIDFLISEAGEISLLEVKSGKSWQAHPSLDKIRRTQNWKFKNAYVFCQGNVSETDGILELPWYMLMFLRPEESLPDIPFNYEGLNFLL